MPLREVGFTLRLKGRHEFDSTRRVFETVIEVKKVAEYEKVIGQVEDITKQKGTKADEYEGDYVLCKCSGAHKHTMIKRGESCPHCGRSYEEILAWETRYF